MAAGHRARNPEKCRVSGFGHGWIWGPKGCSYISPLGFAQVGSDSGPRAGPGQTELPPAGHMIGPGTWNRTRPMSATPAVSWARLQRGGPSAAGCGAGRELGITAEAREGPPPGRPPPLGRARLPHACLFPWTEFLLPPPSGSHGNQESKDAKQFAQGPAAGICSPSPTCRARL